MPYIAWELVDHATMTGQEQITRYYFVDPTGLGTSAGLNAAYQDVILPLLAACQVDQVVHDSVTIRQVFPSLELGTVYPISPTVPGTQTAAAVPGPVTYSLQLVPGPTTDFTGTTVTPYIKRGGKHIGGVSFSYIEDDGGYAGGNDAAVQAFGNILIPPATTPYGCAIVTRESGEVPTKLAFVLNAIPRSLGTQTTRKVGRGA